jgi:uncharacterized DUF497 family protein
LAQTLECTGFQWDEGNVEKNWVKHKVRQAECEEVFYSEPLLVAVDANHSQGEPRFYALGQTDEGRLLFVVFTIREKLIRVISARDVSRRERKEYERAQSEAAGSQGPEV